MIFKHENCLFQDILITLGIGLLKNQYFALADNTLFSMKYYSNDKTKIKFHECNC